MIATRRKDAKDKGLTQYHGKVCIAHSDLNGLRATRNGECLGCSRNRTKRNRANQSAEYFGRICAKHPELGGKRTAKRHQCVGCRKVAITSSRLARRQVNPTYSLTCRIRRAITKSLFNFGYTKNSHTTEILGCDWSTFKEYIELRFVDGMSWENRHLWHIDHIIPLATAKTEEDVYRLSHFTNLQPLWATDNLRKGSKIVVDEFHRM